MTQNKDTQAIVEDGYVIDPATIDPTSLQPVSFARRNWLPQAGGKPVSPQSAHRYLTKGLCGVILPHLRRGKIPMTTEAACRWWIAAVDRAERRRIEIAGQTIIGATDDELKAAGLA